ncbi:hypothetical protein HYU45_00945 [Candidatus Daviesbacteria bacterium]|nr:hypothetical protein [Candidatus Daviesbacteria bacterium]
MEVFRYATSSEWQHINKIGSLKPKHLNGDFQPIYVIPEHPLLWGHRETFELIRWIETVSGEPVNALMKFDIPILKPGIVCYVQEGNSEPWFKMETRKHVSLYRRGDYTNPEFAIYEEIPRSEIFLV